MRRGVTRVEVLIVVVLILVGLGLALTFIRQNRGRSAEVHCAENLRRIGIAIYEREGLDPKILQGGGPEAGRGALPAARISDGYATWAVQLAPFLKQESYLTRWDMGLPFTQQSGEVRDAVVDLFLCPARSRTTNVFRQEEKERAMGGAVGDYACASGDGDDEYPWTGPRGNGAIIEGAVDKMDAGGRIVKWHSLTSLGDLAESKREPSGRGLAYTILIGEKHVPQAELLTLKAGDGSLYDGRHPTCYARVGGKGFGLAAGPDAPFNYNFGSYHEGFSQFLFADLNVQKMAVGVGEEVLGGLIRRWR